MLCWRCEVRAAYCQAEAEKKGSGHAPRYECGDIKGSQATCYAFRPVRPIVTVESKLPSDKRFRFGGTLLGTRERAVRLADKGDRILLDVVKLKKGEACLVYRQLTVAEWRERIRKLKAEEREMKATFKRMAKANKEDNNGR